MNTLHATNQNHHTLLQSIAHRAMLEGGLLPDFSNAAVAELGRLQSPAIKNSAAFGTEHQIRDMREMRNSHSESFGSNVAGMDKRVSE